MPQLSIGALAPPAWARHFPAMIERMAQHDGQTSTAYFSECERYRYGLRRVWAPEGKMLLYVMLNPSTADEQRNDPTIERCQRRALQLGFGGLLIANLFAWRATRPQDLRQAKSPVGPENDALLMDWSATADVTLAAWGVHGALHDRAATIAPRLNGDVRHLGLTRDGHPRHPLYVPYAQTPQPWPQKERYADV